MTCADVIVDTTRRDTEQRVLAVANRQTKTTASPVRTSVNRDLCGCQVERCATRAQLCASGAREACEYERQEANGQRDGKGACRTKLDVRFRPDPPRTDAPGPPVLAAYFPLSFQIACALALTWLGSARKPLNLSGTRYALTNSSTDVPFFMLACAEAKKSA